MPVHYTPDVEVSVGNTGFLEALKEAGLRRDD